MPNRKPNPLTGPITQLRFVQLRDGRKIMQFARNFGVWETPETVGVEALYDDELESIYQALGIAKPQDPASR